MAMGPGKYDSLCTAAREAATAQGAILFILNGHAGTGFSAQLTGEMLFKVPAILREMAQEIEDSGIAID